MIADIYRLFLFPLILGLSFSILAEEHSVSPSRYQMMASHMAFPDELPHVALFSKDGRCLLQKSIQLGWKSEELANPEKLMADLECPRFLSGTLGSSQPESQTHWRIHLWTLDVPSCLACAHAESEIRALVDQFPDRFRMEFWRVNLASQ